MNKSQVPKGAITKPAKLLFYPFKAAFFSAIILIVILFAIGFTIVMILDHLWYRVTGKDYVLDGLIHMDSYYY